MKPINNTNSFSLRRLIKVMRIDLSAYSLSRRMYIGIGIPFFHDIQLVAQLPPLLSQADDTKWSSLQW